LEKLDGFYQLVVLDHLDKLETIELVKNPTIWLEQSIEMGVDLSNAMADVALYYVLFNI